MEINVNIQKLMTQRNLTIDDLRILSDGRIDSDKLNKTLEYSDLEVLAECLLTTIDDILKLPDLESPEILFWDGYRFASKITDKEYYDVMNPDNDWIETIIIIVEIYCQNQMIVAQSIKDVFHSDADWITQLRIFDNFRDGMEYYKEKRGQ